MASKACIWREKKAEVTCNKPLIPGPKKLNSLPVTHHSLSLP